MGLLGPHEWAAEPLAAAVAVCERPALAVQVAAGRPVGGLVARVGESEPR